MDQLHQVSATIALTLGVAWASGINLYAAILVLGLLGATGNMTLPPGLQILADPLVLTAAGLMYTVEFFADKVPGVDTGWDVLHTFIRIPAGALLAAGAVGDVNPALSLAAGLVGGLVAAGTHAGKAGTRVLLNTSPEPFTNIIASVSEDTVVLGGMWLATQHPASFLVLFVLFAMLLAWALPRLWKAITFLLAKLRGFFGGPPAREPALEFHAAADEDRRPTL